MIDEKIMVRLRGAKPTYKVLFDGAESPDIGLERPEALVRAVLYSPQVEADKTAEWYYVELDEEQKHKMVEPYIDALSFGFEYVKQEDYYSINAIYKLSGRQFTISKVPPAARIGENGKTMVDFAEDGVSVRRLSFMVDITGDIDAYYDGKDRIYFAKFSRAKALFRDFNEFYQEAYYDSMEAFLDFDLFAVSEIEPEDIGISEANKIAQILDNNNLDLTSSETVKRVQAYARKYPLSGVVINSDGRIKITTKDDLSCTINLLSERYFTSEITGEVLQARSAEKMKDQKAKKVFNGQEVMIKDK